MSKDLIFIPNELVKELGREGLSLEKGAPSFEIEKTEGILVSEDVVSNFVKETGTRIEKTKTDYEGIYQVLGYIPKAKGKTEEIEVGKAAAVAGENDEPSVKIFDMSGVGSPKTLKKKLQIAIAAMQEVCNEIS